MKPLFSIGSEEPTENKHALLLEVGPDYCSYAFLNEEEKSFDLIGYIAFDEFDIVESLDRILNELKKYSPQKVIVCSAFCQALLIPQNHFTGDYSLLHSIYDLPAQKHFIDRSAEWQIITMYSVPEDVYEVIKATFPEPLFFHAYTPSLKKNVGTDGDRVTIHFATRFFRVMVKKDQQIQLAQTYSYKTSLDVIYYLLKICYEFNLNQSEIVLIVSGLVEESSAMYEELHNYFLNLQFAETPLLLVPENDHPHYYFTSLYNLATCVL